MANVVKLSPSQFGDCFCRKERSIAMTPGGLAWQNYPLLDTYHGEWIDIILRLGLSWRT